MSKELTAEEAIKNFWNSADIVAELQKQRMELTVSFLKDAMELACKNGYAQGVKDFAERVKTYYRHTTSKPLPATVEYYVDQIAKEMLEGG